MAALLCAGSAWGLPVQDRPQPFHSGGWIGVTTEGATGEDAAALGDVLFARYLLDRAAEPPSPGDSVVIGGTTHEWLELDGDEAGRVQGPAALAYAPVVRGSDAVFMAKLSGASTLFVNGDGFVGVSGDPEFEGVPVALREGRNDLYVSGASEGFRLELVPTGEELIVGRWQAEDLEVAWGQDHACLEPVFPIHNASTRWLDGLHVHYEDNVIFGESARGANVTEWADGFMLPPLCSVLAPVFACADWPATRTRAWIGLNVYHGDPATSPWRVDQSLELDLVEDPRPPLPEFEERGYSGPWRRRLREALFVYGTLEIEAETAELVGRLRFDMQTWWRREVCLPSVYSDTRYVEEMENGGWIPAWNMVIYGNAETNAAWDRLLSPDCPIQAGRGILTLGGRTFERDDLLCLFVHRRSDVGEERALVGVVADTGVRGARLGYALEPFASAPGLPDAVVYSPALLDPEEQGILATASFDPTWKLVEDDR